VPPLAPPKNPDDLSDSLTATWRIRVSPEERARVEKQARRWPGYSVWLRQRLLWAVDHDAAGPEPPAPAKPRTAFLTARFSPRDLDAMATFCERHGLSQTEWARAIALAPDSKLQAI